MTKFRDTAAAAAFIATADARETSPEVMQAIVFFARDAAEAEAIWDGSAIGVACDLVDIWEHATNNGANDVNLCWGAEGERWAERPADEY
jgi:hypothetical protein